MGITMTSRSAFISAAALKWGGLLWLGNVLAKVTYRYLFGTFSLDWDLVGYAVFSILFCCGAGCVLGALMWRRGVRENFGQKL